MIEQIIKEFIEKIENEINLERAWNEQAKLYIDKHYSDKRLDIMHKMRVNAAESLTEWKNCKKNGES